ncbi:MAG: sigma-70 family RNA polymerase sigma factor, partial [Acidobacteriota bacterium]
VRALSLVLLGSQLGAPTPGDRPSQAVAGRPAGRSIDATIPRVPKPQDVHAASSDQHLVDRVVAGDPRAADELVRRFRDLIIGMARSRYGFDAPQAEELLQTVIAVLWNDEHRALRAWRGQSKLSTYLAVIVCRQCRQTIVEQQRRRAVEAPPTTVDRATSADAGPDHETWNRERRMLVRDALAQLSARDRLVLTFRFLDELAPKDFAPILGLSPGAARKAVHDALGRLRRRLPPEELSRLPFESGSAP